MGEFFDNFILQSICIKSVLLQLQHPALTDEPQAADMLGTAIAGIDDLQRRSCSFDTEIQIGGNCFGLKFNCFIEKLFISLQGIVQIAVMFERPCPEIAHFQPQRREGERADEFLGIGDRLFLQRCSGF